MYKEDSKAVKVVVEIEATAKNRLINDKYKELVLANYKEPGLNGHFDDCTKDVLKELHVQLRRRNE